MAITVDAHSRDTLPMSVANMTFLVNRLGEDCAPLQFVRELTQNGLEGIAQAPERTGEVIWDVDSQDWNGASVDAIVAANARLTNGQIILMHDWPQNTIAALPGIIQDLQARNLCPGQISSSTGRAVAPPGGGGGGGGGSCTVSVSRGQEWTDRFNVNLAVSGSNTWTVTIRLNGSQSLQNSWNASISGTSGTLTARPNGAGNNFGITLFKNGNTTTPTATCAAS